MSIIGEFEVISKVFFFFYIHLTPHSPNGMAGGKVQYILYIII